MPLITEKSVINCKIAYNKIAICLYLVMRGLAKHVS